MGKKNFMKKANVFKGESNPFNMKLNREKHCILGQKIKGTKGLRGVSRAAIHAKRTELFHKTKLSVEKANHFVDKRLMDGSLTAEENTVNRLVHERKKKLKKNIFNLNDEEELTHKEVPFHDVEDFGGKESGSDDEEQMNATFVKKAHFGGFSSDQNSKSQSHKELIDQLIIDSKQKKQEKKVERELNADLTDKLDKDWKDNLSILSSLNIGKKNAPAKIEAYDIAARELKFESRGAPTSRSKTEEELEKEEQERLYKLEKGRLERMVDDMEYQSIKDLNHLSADSIYDDFDLQPMPVEEVRNAGTSKDDKNDSEYSDSEQSEDSLASEPPSEDESEIANICVPEYSKTEELTSNALNIPESVDEFEKFLDQSNMDISEALDEILKPYLKAKSERILNKLTMFFGIVIEYALKCLHDKIEVTGKLGPYLHVISEISPVPTAEKFLSFLDNEHQLFQDSKGKKKKNNFPRLECLFLLRYCSLLYSVSDFRHPVVTPAIIFMCDILSSDYSFTFSNVVCRLFVCDTILNCVLQSKRLVPEVLCFLSKLLDFAIESNNGSSAGQTRRSKNFNLVLKEKQTSSDILDLTLLNLDGSKLDDSKRLSIIFKSINLLLKFSALYKHLPSYFELFSEVLSICSQVPTDVYPTKLTEVISLLVQEIKETPRTLRFLTYENTKPKPLKLFEPSFQSKFDKKDTINKKYKLLKRVSQKIRKEEKGLLREMRRDVQVVASEKLKERLESDAERKRKVKELYHDLATQEGEYKKSMKKK